MSPEQGRGDPLDARSDLYAVGVILYQLLTGRLPFEAESPTQVVLMHLSKPPPDPRKVAPERHDRRAARRGRPQVAREGAEGPVRQRRRVRRRPCSARSPRSRARRACGSAKRAAWCKCRDVRRHELLDAEVLRRLRRGDHGEQAAARSATGRPRRGPSALSRRISAVTQQGEIDPRPQVARSRSRSSAATRTSRGSTSAAARRRRASSRCGSSASPAWARPASSTSSSRRAPAPRTSSSQAGPDPTWAEIGYYTLRTAIRALAELPADGGAARDWVAASAEARRGISDVFEKPESRLVDGTRRSRPKSAGSPRPKRSAGRSGARANAGRGAVSCSRSTTCKPSTAPAATRSPTSSASRPWPRSSSSPCARPASTRGGPPWPMRRARSAGCPAAVVAKLVRGDGRAERTLVQRRARRRAALSRSGDSLRARAWRAAAGASRRSHRPPRGAPPGRRAPRAPGRRHPRRRDGRLRAHAALARRDRSRRGARALAARGDGRERAPPAGARRTRSCAKSFSRPSRPPFAAGSTRPRPRATTRRAPCSKSRRCTSSTPTTPSTRSSSSRR